MKKELFNFLAFALFKTTLALCFASAAMGMIVALFFCNELIGKPAFMYTIMVLTILTVVLGWPRKLPN